MRDHNLHILGQQIRRFRTERNISQIALAHKLGFNQNYIGQIERGERNPTTKTILSIAFALEVHPYVLFMDAKFNVETYDD